MMIGDRPASTIARRVRAATAALLAAVLGCGAPPRAPGTVVYASGADLESANPLVTVHPLSRQVQRHALFVTLARYDSALAPRPYAARSWEWSADRRRLTLRLEPRLRWHDGRPTTAADVAFTLDAARDPATGYPRYADLAAVAAVRTPDSATVVVDFSAPQPGFPPVLCELPILPEHRLGRVPRHRMRTADFNLDPVGNGPFRFAERRPGERWVFVRNAAFPSELGGPPRLDRLVVAVVDEPTTKFAGLVSGDLDVAGIAPATAQLAERDPSIRVIDYPQLFSYALVFNVTRPPFDDVRVRRALSLAIDRPRIVRAALAGFAVPAASPVPAENPLALAPDQAAADERSAGPAERDIRVADSLLDAAGWARGRDGVRARGGRTLSFELLTVGSGDNAIEQLVQSDLAARGVRARIRQLELGAFLATARARPKSFDALVTGIPGDLSLAYLAAMHDSRQAGGALDYSGYHTPRLDSLFAAVRVAGSERALADAWAGVQRELEAQVPEAWIYHARGVQGVARRLRGVTMDLRGEMATLAEWHVAGEAPTAVAAAPR
jgi:peptide/nickel transport system substrate-binding protein